MQQRGDSFKLGLPFFVIAVTCFGLQSLGYTAGLTHVAPGPPWTASHLPMLLTGLLLVLSAIGLVAPSLRRPAAMILAAAFLLQSLIVYLPPLLTQLRNPQIWTPLFELLGLCGASLFIAGRHGAAPNLQGVGRILFASSLAVFAVQHFLYGPFVATLIPAWIPLHLGFAYLVGLAFLASGVAILIRRADRWAAILLGSMFLSWVLVLHLPRVIASPHSGDEWTSALIALAFCGAAWVFA